MYLCSSCKIKVDCCIVLFVHIVCTTKSHRNLTSIMPVKCRKTFLVLNQDLDKIWSMYDFVYDYRASPLAAGS